MIEPRRWWLWGAVRHYPLPCFSILALVIVLPFALGLVPTVRFLSERIDVHVYPAEIRVDGRYVYRNPFPFPVRQGFVIPFPVDGEHPEPTEVLVTDLTLEAEPLPLAHRFGATVFEADFAASEVRTIRVQYRQTAAGDHATYILTTTQPWRRPLEDGVYTLYPQHTMIVASNYPLVERDGLPGFQMTAFMPTQDWQFSWRKTDAANQ